MGNIRNYTRVKRAIMKAYRDGLRKDLETVAAFDRGERHPDRMNESDERALVERIRDYIQEPRPGRKAKKGTLAHVVQEYLDRLDRANAAPRFREMKCEINWSRSRMWGSCPTAETWIWGDNFDGNCGLVHHTTTHANGCGYDKCSAAVDDGMQCALIDRLIIENAASWKKYAVDVSFGFPSLRFGGKGVETLRGLFCAYGGKRAPIPGFSFQWDEGKNWDLIRIQKKGK